MSAMKDIALFGNPNTGKTSLFNRLTGSYEYVGNWSGVTVEKKVGVLSRIPGRLIDLPGIYSLIRISRDEEVVTHFLLHESFDAVLNIVDASQVQRNLHLTVQLLEFGKPVVVGLNMIDVAAWRGIAVDAALLAQELGVPVIPIVARTGKGCEPMADQLRLIETGVAEQSFQPLLLAYDKDVEEAVQRIVERLRQEGRPTGDRPPLRWLALQFLEGNTAARRYIGDQMPLGELDRIAAESQDWADRIYKPRLQFIESILERAVSRPKDARWTACERMDEIFTHRWLGMPIFLMIMYLIFKLTFDWLGSPLSDRLDQLIGGPLTEWADWTLSAVGATEFIRAAVLNGIISGVGGVIVFIPQIFILFLFISWIEDSGYMARIALVMDRLMESFGLNGKTFIPMIIGFGCNVPGIMAARSIEQPKERLLTILLTPLMSCSARLTVYSLFVGTFFRESQAIIVLGLYVLGILVALALAKLFSSVLLKGERSTFVIELPPYRMPRFSVIWRSTWDKGKGFVKKAGTFIFGGSVLIWLLSYVGPGGVDVPVDQSYLAAAGGWIASLATPLGFGTWQAGAALVTGFFAKEVVVATMNILYFVPDTEALQTVIRTAYSPLQALSFMVFILLYTPCLSTVAVIQKETGSRSWTGFSVVYALAVAYALSAAIYGIGSALGY